MDKDTRSRLVQLRPMQAGDLPAGLALTQALRWAHRALDWQLHFELGHGHVAVDADGAVRGTIIWWDHGPAAATLGFVVVDDGLQGQGVGRRLVDVVLAESAARAVQLMSTQAGFKLYQQSGFVATGRIEQRQADVGAVPAAPVPAGLACRSATPADLPALEALDARAFGGPRARMLAAVLAMGRGLVLCRGSAPVAFALMRPAGRGRTIGPVVAEDESQAIALIGGLLAGDPGFTRLDVPDTAMQLRQWLDAAGIVRVDDVTAMVRGQWPVPSPGAVQRYGLASQALG